MLMSDLLSKDLLHLLDDHESSSSTEEPAVPIPAPPPLILCLHARLPVNRRVPALSRWQRANGVLTRQRNRNTERKTKPDVTVWHNWYKSVGETRLIGDIPPGEVNKLLAHFFTKGKKWDGSDYEPDLLTHLQRSLERHLRVDWARIIAFCKTDSFRYLMKPL